MRDYYGGRDPDTGRGWAWAIQRPGQHVRDVLDLLDEIRAASDHAPPGETRADHDTRVGDLRQRKQRLLGLLEADAARQPAALTATLDAEHGYGWGGHPGGVNLAHAILLHEIGERAPAVVCERFARDLLDPVPDPDRLHLAGDLVWGWIEANRRLIEVEVFEKIPQPSVEPHPRGDEPGAGVSWPSTLPVDHRVAPSAGAGTASVEADGRGVSPAAASEVVRACEEAWDRIRAHHPELPPAVIVLGSGVERGRLVKLGHWWAGRWVADGELRGEVLLAGEALHLAPHEVFEVLLHEAAHGLNAARGIKDTSREGRYHNARFGQAAREVGLSVSAMPPYGVARTELTEEAKERYAEPIGRLGDVMRIARQIDRRAVTGTSAEGRDQNGTPGAGEADERKSKGRSLAVCGCGRKVRVAAGVLAAGPIVCGLCEVEFTAAPSSSPAPDAERGARRGTVDHTFLARRRAALAAAQPPVAAPGDDRRRRAETLIADAAEDLDASAADIAAVTSWYEHFGTSNETPMPAASTAEANRRVALARALLHADGTLQGPAIDTGTLTLAVGDRVVVAVDVAAQDLPAGTLGTVEAIDPDAGALEIDFATWGRLRAGLEDLVSHVLQHDYVEVGRRRHPAAPSVSDGDAGRGLEVAWDEVEP